MRIGLLADAHGNAEGLALCLHVLRQQRVDSLFFLGDALGYFPYGAAVCALLQRAGALCLLGNHEAMAIGILPIPSENEDIYKLSQSIRHVPPRWLEKIAAQGPSCTLTCGNTRILCVHGSPNSPLTGRANPAELLPVPNVDIVALSHTHSPWVRMVGDQLWINCGSCGYPRDHGTMLACATLDTDTRSAKVWRVPFVFRRRLLSACHERIRACTRRICPSPFGNVWRE